MKDRGKQQDDPGQLQTVLKVLLLRLDKVDRMRQKSAVAEYHKQN